MPIKLTKEARRHASKPLRLAWRLQRLRLQRRKQNAKEIKNANG